jgi:hypothetical protein
MAQLLVDVGAQPLDADLTAVAASGVAAAWTAYTPTVTASSGTFTTVSATGRNLIIGKLMLVEMKITITTIGSAAGTLIATLPTGISAFPFACSAYESAVTGFAVGGFVVASQGTLNMVKYDGTTIIGAGRTVNVTLTAEIP